MTTQNWWLHSKRKPQPNSQFFVFAWITIAEKYVVLPLLNRADGTLFWAITTSLPFHVVLVSPILILEVSIFRLGMIFYLFCLTSWCVFFSHWRFSIILGICFLNISMSFLKIHKHLSYRALCLINPYHDKEAWIIMFFFF